MPKSRTAAADSIKKYNAAYSAKKDFVARPNAFLKQCVDQIAPRPRNKTNRPKRRRRALDIGLGQGRNALLLAQRGYDVTGIDRSEVGIRAAVRMAAARGFRGRINAVIADTERFEYGRNRWDLIVLLYYPQPMILIDRLKRAVKPGGHIVVERFSRPNHGKAAHLVDRRETKKPSPMLECFADWHVLHYEHDEFDSDWHWDGESPRGPIVRLLARKPWRLTK
jgi:SAM-dependent methyltransferase